MEGACAMKWGDVFITACKVRFHHLWHFVYNVFCYYLWHPTFFLADMLILGQYFFKSPHRIVRHFDEHHPSCHIGPYGETDFRTMARILDEWDIPPSASVADLGAGRGRLSLFLRLVRHHRFVLGLEYLPLMVHRAERVCRWLRILNLTFQQGDWREISLDGIDVVYLYGFVAETEAEKQLVRHLALLKEGTRIITISSWLGETMPNSFRLEKILPVSFEWGETQAYLQTVLWP
jgi:SAM-dependent methyltransferase